MLLLSVLLLSSCDNDRLTEECVLHVFGADEEPGQNLTWQDPPPGTTMLWSDAKKYCADLSLDGHSDWHLPNITELRSLLRGCPATGACGSCNINMGDCLTSFCVHNSCDGCSDQDGPAGGCYWPDEMQGSCSWYWSSSAVEDLDDRAWRVYFRDGDVAASTVSTDKFVRCVR